MWQTLNGIFDKRPCRPCRRDTKHVLAYNWKEDEPNQSTLDSKLQYWICTRCGFAPNMTGSAQHTLATR